jgi:hypothetical protein
MSPIVHLRMPASKYAASAAPLVQGQGWRITGSGWTSNVPAANQLTIFSQIEAQSNGTALTSGILGANWSKPGSDTQTITTELVWNSTRSILNDFAVGFQFGYQKDLTSTYLAWRGDGYVYCETGSAQDGQLKTDRLGGAAPGAGITDYDGGGECFFQFFPQSDSTDNQFPCNVVRQNSNGSFNSNFTTVQPGARLLDRNGWTRLQQGLIPGSANTSNGSVYVHSRRMSDRVVIANASMTSQLLRGAGDPEYQRCTAQYYWGNGFQNPPNSVNPRCFLDGRKYWIVNYASATLPYTVEFTDAPTYSASNEWVTQIFTSWADGQIDGDFYQGRLPGTRPGIDLWAYVMTAPGVPASSTGIVPVKI